MRNTDAITLRGVKNDFVGAYVRPNSGISAVTVRVDDGSPRVVVSVTDDVSIDLPRAFGGLPVDIELGRPGQVAIGSRYYAA